MWSITLKLMRKTKRMLIPAGIAIMIGTAFIASTFLFGNAMNDSLTRQLTAMFGNANYAVTVNSSDLSDKELNEAYSSTVGDFHLDQIAGIEGVGGVRASVETGVSVSKGDSTVSGEIISTAAQKNMLPVNITEGDQPKDSNEVALPEDMAKQLNVGVGDTVSLTSRYAVGDDGKAKADNVRVVGLTSDPNGAYSYYGGAIVGSNNLLAAMQGVDDFNATGTTMVYLDLALDGNSVSAQYEAVGFVDESHFTNGDLDAATHVLLVKADTDKSGVSVDGIYNDMQAALEKSTDATVTGPIAERIVWANMIDSMMMLLVGLIAVAVLIALVGVANTLSLSVIERTRESATLRAIGMTRGQLRHSLAVEALLISLVSGIAGVLLGTLFGWLGAYVVFSMYGKVVFPFEWGINGIVLAVAAVAALLASVFPARRAVSTPPVEALAEA